MASNTRVDRIALFKKILTYGKSTGEYCKDHGLTNYAAISDKVKKAKEELRLSNKQEVINCLNSFGSHSTNIAFFRDNWLKAIELFEWNSAESISGKITREQYDLAVRLCVDYEEQLRSECIELNLIKANTYRAYVCKSERKDSRICNAKIGDEISYKKKTHKTVNAFTVGQSYLVINETEKQIQVRTNTGGCKWLNKIDHFHAWELI